MTDEDPDVKVFAPGDRIEHLPVLGARGESMGFDARCHLQLWDGAGVPSAQCSLWSGGAEAGSAERAGMIGRFHAESERSAVRLLRAACRRLRGFGCVRAVGPLDGSTWRRYRFVTWSDGSSAFFLEPSNPPEWPAWWTAAGFGPLETYQSAINPDLSHAAGDERRLGDRARAAGLSVRHLDLSRFEDELRAIHDLSCDAFKENPFYSPISWDEFRDMYMPLRPMIDDRLVVMCDDPAHPGRIAGLMLGLPDVGECSRHGRISTVILKTLAVRTDRRGQGIGAWLVAACEASAAAIGMTRSIFALMHDGNPSARIGAHRAHVFRRYTLFSRELSP